MIDVSERNLEATIETALLAQRYRKRSPDDYDRALCLDPDVLIDFLQATQPKVWQRLTDQYGGSPRSPFLKRVSTGIGKRGAVEILRRGVKDRGCSFQLAYFKPVSGLNPELAQLYEANQLTVVRQLKYSEGSEHSLDMVLFLNGVPIFTVELKNTFTGQNVQHAIAQYMHDRDPREPLFGFGRCMAHFAVDPDLVYMTTHLRGTKTFFLPFNQGRDGGAGNPASITGFPTAYLWEDVWTRDSVLNLIQHFIHPVEEQVTQANGRTKTEKKLIFPRYHQRDAVNRLVDHARAHGAGHRYLIQHSAGSGKSNSIAWLAHRLASLHDDDDQRVFDSIVIITDRRVLDRQLQRTVSQFQQVLGVVENIDQTSRQLAEAIEGGKTIIVTTLQKFPVIDEQVRAMAGKRFALIIDEAHSSQSGEASKSVKKVLAGATLEQAADLEAAEPETMEDRILAEMRARGPVPNVSMFAFTATPKQRTLELFGNQLPDGRFVPFSLYSMRQAIEEGFILDVLANYTTYKAYFKLLKTIEDDPKYEQRKAKRVLLRFVDLHDHSIRQKIEILVAHFDDHVRSRIRGKAKAMVVTRSRLHAVRYFLALRSYLQEQKAGYKALVAFSGTVHDEGADYTEFGLNAIPETQTANAFNTDDYRFLVVAEKFQTGFDQPLLHTMYVDKKLGGVHAVQTLSRLNRTHQHKAETMVLDFANEADAVLDAFKPYYEATILSEATDPNQLYDLQNQLEDFDLFMQSEVDAFAAEWFHPEGSQEKLHGMLAPVVDRFRERGADEQAGFRGVLRDYIRLYSFLSQVLTFADLELEKLYVFARMLHRKLPVDPVELPREVLDNVDMDSYRLQLTHEGAVPLEADPELYPIVGPGGRVAEPEDPLEVLSAIIQEINERFGVELTEADRICVEAALRNLELDPALDASVRANTRENAALTFRQKFEEAVQDFVDSNFQLYKRITDDERFGSTLRDALFDFYLRRHREVRDLISQGESKTLEFKSTLRWNLKEDTKDNRITHAVLKTLAAFMNTEGGDLLIGVTDDGTIIGIEPDRFDNDDKFLLHLAQVTRNALGDRAGTCIDPRIHVVDGKNVCLVACSRSPEPVYLKWKGMEKADSGDLFVRSGPGTILLEPESSEEYVRTRFRKL